MIWLSVCRKIRTSNYTNFDSSRSMTCRARSSLTDVTYLNNRVDLMEVEQRQLFSVVPNEFPVKPTRIDTGIRIIANILIIWFLCPAVVIGSPGRRHLKFSRRQRVHLKQQSVNRLDYFTKLLRFVYSWIYLFLFDRHVLYFDLEVNVNLCYGKPALVFFVVINYICCHFIQPGAKQLTLVHVLYLDTHLGIGSLCC